MDGLIIKRRTPSMKGNRRVSRTVKPVNALEAETKVKTPTATCDDVLDKKDVSYSSFTSSTSERKHSMDLPEISSKRLKAYETTDTALPIGEKNALSTHSISVSDSAAIGDSGESDVEEEHKIESKERMAFVKHLQKKRIPTRGVNTKNLCTFDSISKELTKFQGMHIQALFKEEEVEEEEEEEEMVYGLLDKQFTSKTDPYQIQKDKHLEDFIMKNLESNKVESTEATIPRDRESELYQIPERLRVKDTLSDHADKMNWVTGLVEVPISLEVKLKNIEATEKAKRNLLKLGKVDESSRDPNSVDSIVRTAFGSRFQNTDFDRLKTTSATDDAALDRFRRRFHR
ncbi:hypothetical protein IE077_002848 [Cardiosporidium cionae]|uniref:Uncharacterized protein n=1 Tax=Cardiosporidium cionae TaxID=476202 RepID=A0ABQ7J9R8_9APIC|nr:hypothetical protein IE077_002848 [Cardiosporidium cionae]|eukprot:KAF8820745.1 hypothetical protein IE077_002848 [Cardiosporidium cionae]